MCLFAGVLCLNVFITGSFLMRFGYGSISQAFWLDCITNLTLTCNGAPEFHVCIAADELGTATIGIPATGFRFSQAHGAAKPVGWTAFTARGCSLDSVSYL